MVIPAKIRFFRVNTVFKDDQLFKIWFQNRLELADTQRELNKTNIERDLFYFGILVLRKSQIEARMEQFKKLWIYLYFSKNWFKFQYEKTHSGFYIIFRFLKIGSNFYYQ